VIVLLGIDIPLTAQESWLRIGALLSAKKRESLGIKNSASSRAKALANRGNNEQSTDQRR